VFYRAPSTAGWTTGGGIGLYASAVLVHRMGGRLWAHRRPGGGAEFGFALPVLEAA
jgi:K+-sensing histidine kinase KdpD